MFLGELTVLVGPMTVLGVIVLAIVALAGGRSEPDTRGERAYVLYLALVSFVAMFTMLFALSALSSPAIEAVVENADPCAANPSSPECFGAPPAGFEPEGDEANVRAAINAAGVAVAAGVILLLHRGRTRRLLADPGFPGSAGARTFNAYLYAVSFTALAVLLVGAAIAIPAVVRVIAPSLVTTGSSSAERDAALTGLVPSLVLALGAALVYLTHWRAADRLRRPTGG